MSRRLEQIEVLHNRVTEIKCDYCGKVLNISTNEQSWHHTRWGNDSAESIEHRDICDNANCLKKFLVDAQQTLEDYAKTAEINLSLDYEQLENLIKAL